MCNRDAKHSNENETKQNTKSLKYVLHGREIFHDKRNVPNIDATDEGVKETEILKNLTHTYINAKTPTESK